MIILKWDKSPVKAGAAYVAISGTGLVRQEIRLSLKKSYIPKRFFYLFLVDPRLDSLSRSDNIFHTFTAMAVQDEVKYTESLFYCLQV